MAAGCEVIAPDTGCCGMAGSFGYKPQHVEASRRIAGLALLPALEAAKDAVVVASGFSCREQIESLAGRPTLHLAEAAGRERDVSIEVLAYVALVCLLSGFAHGALGFGFPLVATPLVALVIDMKSAITLLAPVTLALVVISALRGGSLRDLVRRYWFMPVGIAAGAWLGTKVLLAAPPEPFMLVLALVLLFYLNLDRLGRGRKRDWCSDCARRSASPSLSSPASSRRSPTSPGRSCSCTSCCSARRPRRWCRR